MLHRPTCLLELALVLLLLTFFSQMVVIHALLLRGPGAVTEVAARNPAGHLLGSSANLPQTFAHPSIDEISGLAKPHKESLPSIEPPPGKPKPIEWNTHKELLDIPFDYRRAMELIALSAYGVGAKSKKPLGINEILSHNSLVNTPEEKLALLQEATKKLAGLSAKNIDAFGEDWLNAIEIINQAHGDVELEMRMNTLVTFVYRDMMHQLSTTFPYRSSNRASLYNRISNVQREREQFYQQTYRPTEDPGPKGRTAGRKNLIEKVDWMQEALLPFRGLGNSADVKSFRRMIDASPSVRSYFEEARRRPSWSRILGKYLKPFENLLRQRNEAQFIQRLGRTTSRYDGKTDSKTKTASIVLLWQLKNLGGKALDGLFDDFSFTERAQTVAAKQVKSLLEPKKARLLWDNDRVLLQTLTIKANLPLKPNLSSIGLQKRSFKQSRAL